MPERSCTPITVAVGGEAYRGSWRIDGAEIEVTSAFGSRRAKLGAAPSEALAAAILAELVRAHLRTH